MMDTNQRHPNAQTGGRAKSLKSLTFTDPRPPHSEIFYFGADYFYRAPNKNPGTPKAIFITYCFCLAILGGGSKMSVFRGLIPVLFNEGKSRKAKP